MTQYVILPLAPEDIEDPEAVIEVEKKAQEMISGENIVGEWQHFNRWCRTWEKGLDPTAFLFRYVAHTVDGPIQVKESGLP